MTLLLPHRRGLLTVSAPVVAAPVSQWWLSGGVDAGVCFGAYRGKGAASEAASWQNLNNPGTHDLYWSGLLDAAGNPNGAGPVWDTATGWAMLGETAYFRMTGGWFPTSTAVTFILQVANAADFSMQFCGASAALVGGGAGSHRSDGMSVNNTGGFQDNHNWGEGDYGGNVNNGNMAVAGKAYFVDGVKKAAAIAAGSGTNAYDWNWGCENWSDTAHGGGAHTLIAMAAYDAILTDDQVTAIATAMAAF